MGGMGGGMSLQEALANKLKARQNQSNQNSSTSNNNNNNSSNNSSK